MKSDKKKESSFNLFLKIIKKSDLSELTCLYLKFLRLVVPRYALIHAIEKIHPDTYLHCKEVASLSVKICREYNENFKEKIPEQDVKKAALFHDIGKIGISKKLINQKNLSSDDLQHFRQHPILGAKLVDGILDKKIKSAISQHQEEIDGSGYPKGLSGNQLNLITRIITVADDFCAMTQYRGYNIVKTTDEALLDISEKSGRRYDDNVIEAFKNVLTKRGLIVE